MQEASFRDPLGSFAAGLRLGGEAAPLRDTRIAVRLAGGLATVATSRHFVNAAQHAIEAVLTWPVPTAAVVHGLALRIGDRVLRAEARDRPAARVAYEAALHDGRTAVLHEEVLKGVHMLSIGQVPPGGSVEVGTLWTMPMALRGDEAEVRIPTTVGDVYGRDPLPPSDALLADGPPATARIAVFGGRDLRLNGAPLAEGAEALAALDLPIVVRCRPAGAVAWGRDPANRDVAVGVTPSSGCRSLDLRVLVDCSGSTAGAFDPTRPDGSVWDVSGLALEAALGGLRADDVVTVWDFNHDAHRLGSAAGPAAARLVARRPPPSGGTEIGLALAAAGVGDILLVTDGLSYALDPLAVAATGARVSALLVGADSLDAAIGHAVALTGGSLAVAGGEGEGAAQAAAALAALLADLRALSAGVEASGLPALPERLAVTRGGARIEVEWGRAPPDRASRDASLWLEGTALARAGLLADPVAAYAAGLALPRLAEAEARRVAVAHGLATHLTSLLVVDLDGEVQDGVPEQRKIALPRSRGRAAPPAFASPSPPASPPAAMWRASGMASRAMLAPRPCAQAPAQAASRDLAAVAWDIDWDRQGAPLSRGELSSLGPEGEVLVRRAAALPEVAVAVRAGEDAIALVVALMARFCGRGRTAGRVAARLRRIAVADRLEAAEAALGLAGGGRPPAAPST